MSYTYSAHSFKTEEVGKLAILKSLFYFLATGTVDEKYVRGAKLERKNMNVFFKKLSRKKFLFLPSHSNSKIMTLGLYINELLFEQNCVVVPGLGGFITRKVPAQINPVSNKITPPGKKVAFNQALNVNDGILAKYVAEKENISYEVALDKIQDLLVELKQTLFEIRTVHLEKVGTFYMDFDEVTTFHPDADLNVSKENYGLITLTATPVQRSNDEKLKLKIKTRVDQRSKDISSKRKQLIPLVAKAVAACLVIGLSFTAYLYLPQIRNFNMAALNPSALFQSSEAEKVVAPVAIKHMFSINANQKAILMNAAQATKSDTTWSVLINHFSSISAAKTCIEDLQAQQIDARFSIREGDQTWVSVAKTGSKHAAMDCVNTLKSAYPEVKILGISN